jgi:cytochrome c
MSHRTMYGSLLAAAVAFGVLSVQAPAFAQDAEAAQLLFKQNECHKCHNPDKDKKGPSLKKIAAKYKGKPDSDAKMTDHMTKGAKVKLEDGSEEDHKVLDTKDPKARKNLIDWMLSH